MKAKVKHQQVLSAAVSLWPQEVAPTQFLKPDTDAGTYKSLFIKIYQAFFLKNRIKLNTLSLRFHTAKSKLSAEMLGISGVCRIVSVLFLTVCFYRAEVKLSEQRSWQMKLSDH